MQQIEQLDAPNFHEKIAEEPDPQWYVIADNFMYWIDDHEGTILLTFFIVVLILIFCGVM